MTANRVVATLFAVSLLVIARGSVAATAHIDFESYPGGAPTAQADRLDVQYSSLGVIFEPRGLRAAAITNTAVPHSGTFVAAGPDNAQEFGDTDFKITFASPQSLVQLYGGSGACGTEPATLTAFDSGGNPLATDTHPMVAGVVSTFFSVGTSTPQIHSVSYHVPSPFIGNCFEFIDDLHIEGNPPPPTGPPPSIILTAPPPGASNFVTQALQAMGTFTGTNLLPVIRFDLVILDPPPGQPSAESQFFSLTPQQTNGTDIPFSFVVKAAAALPIGRYRITATIKDLSGQQAQASVDFSNFPSPLTDSDPSFGPFRFGVVREGCQMAFYEGGAYAHRPAVPGGFIPVPVVIAEKWRTVSTPMLWPFSTLGCPINTHQVTSSLNPDFNNWRAQDFERGRIYAPPQGAAVYTTGLFRTALVELAETPQGPGGITTQFHKVGWPVSDPTYDLEVENPTWMFQRFAQNNLGPAWQNTLEIRGRTPFLYVERVGGDPDERSLAQATPTNPNPTPRLDAATATQWQIVQCTKQLTDRWPVFCSFGTMAVTRPDLVQPTLVAHYCGGQFSCDNGTPNACSSGCPKAGLFTPPPPDWASAGGVFSGNTDLTNYYQGIIRDLDVLGPSSGSHLANADSPFSHEYCNTTLGRTAGNVADIALEVGHCLIGPLTSCDLVNTASNIDYCRSDWNLHTRPVPMQSNWDFLAPANLTVSGQPLVNFEIEVEAMFMFDYLKRFVPIPGDLVTVHGRRIIDCGHCPYRAEVHPVDMMVVERSDVYFGVFAGDPDFRATNAYVWANGFLPQAPRQSLAGDGHRARPATHVRQGEAAHTPAREWIFQATVPGRGATKPSPRGSGSRSPARP